MPVKGRPNTRKGVPNKLSLTALDDMERMNINPIEYLDEVFKAAMGAYKSGRGYSDKGDAGPYYLSVAGKAAVDLAKFKHPIMSAIAIGDLTKENVTKQVTTSQEALAEILKDPFAPKEVKEISPEKVIKAMASQIKTPFLPSGDGNG